MNKRELLDEVFSRYIRARDCPNGQGRCITCGKPITFATCDAGHYISRRVTATRWNEANVHAQCVECNRHKYGCEEVYRKALVEMYGLPAVLSLEEKKHTTVRLRDSDYTELINYYKEKLKNYDRS